MTGLFKLPAPVRRQAYIVALLIGAAGLISLMLTDTRATIAGNPALAHAFPGASITALKPGQAGGRPLVAGEALDGFASFSPDGKRLAFMRDGQISVAGASGQGAKGVSQNGRDWDAAPAWRPDGKAIAFIRILPGGTGSRVMLLDPATAEETQLLVSQEPIGYLAWDPQGKSLYFTTPAALHRLDPESKKSGPIYTARPGWEMTAGGLAISPDGKTAVFGAGPREGRSVYYDLWSLPLGTAGALAERLTEAGGIMPAFDQAGRRLAYRNPRQATGIYVMELATHQTRAAVPDTAQAMYFHPVFAPGGKSLAVSQLSLSEGKEGERLVSHIRLVPLP